MKSMFVPTVASQRFRQNLKRKETDYMALTPAQLEKKVTDLENKLKDVDKRLTNLKDGTGGTDSNLLELQRRVGNIDKSISSLVDSVDKINAKLNE
jgi:peptidoglycan hydrolase CwlO-like protein